MKFSYNTIAIFFDIVDTIFFKLGKNNPRKKIYDMIPNDNIQILDICTGTGSNIIKLAKNKSRVNITGIDNSFGMLNVGLKKIAKYNLNNIKFLLQDATDMKFNNKYFDYAIISLILHEMDYNIASIILQNTYKVLKDNGKLIVFEFIYPTNNNLITKIIFQLIKKVEDNQLFPAFLDYNKEIYFKNNGFKIENTYTFQYSIIYELVKI